MVEQEGQEFLEESKFKKILIFITTIFILFLIGSYFLLSYPLYPIIGSLSESKIIKNNTIELDGFSIVFTNNTYEKLKESYLQNQKVEISMCLKGIKNKDYIITSIYQPEIIEQSFNHVIFKQCSVDSLIMLHSHPFKRCIASYQDIKTLKDRRKINQDTLMLIMCEADRFTVYAN